MVLNRFKKNNIQTLAARIKVETVMKKKTTEYKLLKRYYYVNKTLHITRYRVLENNCVQTKIAH